MATFLLLFPQPVRHGAVSLTHSHPHRIEEGSPYPGAQTIHQERPTPERVTMLCSSSKGDRSGPPPRLAVGGLAGRKENGPILTLYHVYYIKPISPREGDDGRGSLLAPGGLVPGDKTGLRSDPHSHSQMTVRTCC